MSNRQPRRPAASTTYPAHPVTAAPTYRPVSSRTATDRRTATYPTGYPLAQPATAYPLPEGWQADPSGYLPEGPATAARLQREDAAPTGVFPTRRSIRPQHEGADAASLSHGGAGAHAVYHTAQHEGAAAPSRTPATRGRHPHLRAALTGVLLASALLTGLQLYALDGINDARSQARAAHSHSHSQASPTAAPVPDRAPAAQDDARTGIQPTLSGQWVTQDSGAPYAKDDPSASPLSLPRCTTSPTTPMPCLAHVSADSSHAVVLEEDASLTGLVRQ